jgi:hypothetical protein
MRADGFAIGLGRFPHRLQDKRDAGERRNWRPCGNAEPASRRHVTKSPQGHRAVRRDAFREPLVYPHDLDRAGRASRG